MYDLHNHLLFKTSHEELKRFQFKNFGVVFSNKEKLDLKNFNELKKQSPFNLFSGIEIHAEQSGEVKKALDRYRRQVDFVMVHAKDQRAVRAAAESKHVDIIAHAFIDQTAAREAGKNKVAIEVNLKDILSMYRMKRAVLLSKIKFNLELARKYKVPVILSTGAKTIYDMRSSRQIIALAECIGFTHLEAKNALFKNPRKILGIKK